MCRSGVSCPREPGPEYRFDPSHSPWGRAATAYKELFDTDEDTHPPHHKMSHDTESLKNNEVSAIHQASTDADAIRKAMAAAAEEKAMGFKAVMRIHWKAAMWSCIFSLALVMEGYDLGIVSKVYQGLVRADSPDQLILWSSLVPQAIWKCDS